MCKMEITEATPIQMAMPTPTTSVAQPSTQVEKPDTTPRAQAKSTTAKHQASSPANSPQNTYAASPIDTLAPTPKARGSFTATPASTSAAEPQPPPAQTTEPAPSIQILQLHNQLQRMEARKLQFIEETKNHWNYPPMMGKTSLTCIHPLSIKYNPTQHLELRTSQKRKVLASAKREALSIEHPPPEIPATNIDPARRRGKALAGRIITRDRTSSLDDEEQSPPRPAKRQRRYHVITIDSDDDSTS
ncbi:hypothetical protein V6N12_037237 [Hibiscus sabdariffa]|uniref:Uncharacterized protein n=1 Tax=Hibiscus sabdariffa TaxID=183260 RepID=A0ABR2C397_9ROSI